MRIILSPAKQMTVDNDAVAHETLPVFLEQATELAGYMRSLSYAEAKKLWGCNDKLAEQNYERFARMDLKRNLTPAVLAYDGIAFKYMAPGVFETDQFRYAQERLRILSGFYGVLRAMDGVTPYRLEMQAKARPCGCRDLYAYWGERIYDEVQRGNDGRVIVNLASKEYSRCVEKYLRPEDRYVSCVFAEEAGDGKLVQKGVYAKMARGEMVRYMAETAAEHPEDLQGFDRLGYRFAPKHSEEMEYVFLRE